MLAQHVSTIAGTEYRFDTNSLRWLSIPPGAARTVSSLRGMTPEQLKAISEAEEAQMWTRHAISSSDEGAEEMRQRVDGLVDDSAVGSIPCKTQLRDVIAMSWMKANTSAIAQGVNRPYARPRLVNRMTNSVIDLSAAQ